MNIINDLRVALSPLLTHSLPLREAGRALKLLENKQERAIKITLRCDGEEPGGI